MKINDNDKPQDKGIINVANVCKSFVNGKETTEVLKDISFQLQEKTFNIIYGPSGSGKSTLLNVMIGLQEPTSGNVLFAGRNLYNLSPDELAHFRASEIGIVYQQNYWVKSLNVLENVSMPMYFSGCSRSSATYFAMDALDKVNMSDYANKQPSMLSGGEQQRVAVARALVNSPQFIVADEPTGSLDSANGSMIMELLQKCKTDLGRTVILVSHNMEYVPLADHLIRIEDGIITETTGEANIATAADHMLADMKKHINNLVKAKNRA